MSNSGVCTKAVFQGLTKDFSKFENKTKQKNKEKQFFLKKTVCCWGESCLNDRMFGFSVRCGPPVSVSFRRSTGRIGMTVTWQQEEKKKIGHFAVNYSAQGSSLGSQVSATDPLWPGPASLPLWSPSNLSRSSAVRAPVRVLPLTFGCVSLTAAAAVGEHYGSHGGGCELLPGLHRAGRLREQQ